MVPGVDRVWVVGRVQGQLAVVGAGGLQDYSGDVRLQLASGMPGEGRPEHVLYLASEFVPPTGYLTSIHNRRQPGRLALAAGSDERWVRVRAV